MLCNLLVILKTENVSEAKCAGSEMYQERNVSGMKSWKQNIHKPMYLQFVYSIMHAYSIYTCTTNEK